MSADSRHRAGVPDGGSRLPSLTGLRFVAAVLVFCYHLSREAPFASPGADKWLTDVFGKAGSIGVSFFFILSGFILTWTAKPGEPLRRFWTRRIAKIYPNHVATWVLALVLILWAGRSLHAGTAVANLFLVHSWVPRMDVAWSMNDVSWTLACELLFYLCFPLLHRWVGRIRENLLWVAAAVVVAVAFCVPAIAGTLPSTPDFGGISAWQVWFAYMLPPVRALDFVLGIVMARIVLSGRWIRLPVVPAALLVIAGWYVATELPRAYGFAAATLVPLALLIPAVATSDLDGTPSPLRGRAAMWLGEISFAFYLIHRLVLVYGHQAFGARHTWPMAQALGLVAVALVLSVLLAWALHQAVEQPVMRLVRDRERARAERKRPVEAAVPAG
ncbi:acyltransferase family protein [Streptomyces sp. NPDC020799]|uniref:acyltransferase family protein n=1 Tax=Streptomyces sp. NPDC020799 TaxID=3365091 RepID=UPI0037BB0DA4